MDSHTILLSLCKLVDLSFHFLPPNLSLHTALATRIIFSINNEGKDIEEVVNEALDSDTQRSCLLKKYAPKGHTAPIAHCLQCVSCAL